MSEAAVPKVKRPGGEMSTRPLHFFWLCDTSGSMDGRKIKALNDAIRQALLEMRRVADDNPNASVLMRALNFGAAVKWINTESVSVRKYEWADLEAGGSTPMGEALKLAAQALDMSKIGERALPPVLVLISDGQPDDRRTFDAGLAELLKQPWGKKAVRVAIAIGEDADMDVLRSFMGDEKEPLRASSADDLIKHIRWVSTAVLKAVSTPVTAASASPTAEEEAKPIAVPTASGDGGDEIW